jgi:hypothetical protein
VAETAAAYQMRVQWRLSKQRRTAQRRSTRGSSDCSSGALSATISNVTSAVAGGSMTHHSSDNHSSGLNPLADSFSQPSAKRSAIPGCTLQNLNNNSSQLATAIKSSTAGQRDSGSTGTVALAATTCSNGGWRQRCSADNSAGETGCQRIRVIVSPRTASFSAWYMQLGNDGDHFPAYCGNH